MTSAGIKDQQFLKLIETVSNECEVCQLYKKPSPKPIVGFPNARVFNQTVAMDLKRILQKCLVPSSYRFGYTVLSSCSYKK